MKLNSLSSKSIWILVLAFCVALLVVLPYFAHISKADFYSSMDISQGSYYFAHTRKEAYDASEALWCTSQGGTPVWTPIDAPMAGGFWDCMLPPPGCPSGFTGTPPNCTDPNAFCCSGGYCGMEPSCTVLIQTCTSAPNACGQTNGGITDGNGACIATVPPNPAIYGSACTSAANSCGMTNPGTYSCTGVCGAVAPANTACYAQGYYAPSYSQAAYYAQGYYAPSYSQAAYYAQGYYAPGYSQASYYSYSQGAYTSCGARSVTITAVPNRVKSGQTTTLTLTGAGITTSCVVTGPGVNTTVSPSSCSASRTITTPVITAQSVYKVNCDSGAATAQVIINLIPSVVEF